MHDYEERHITTNGIQLHVVLAGAEDGEPLLLLHGFPEFWYGWNKQIPFLVQEGYRVIVPDQRGYNLSDKPAGVRAYALDTLAADITGLMDALGYEQVNLVGHDWGAAVAWWVATVAPQRLKKLVILNVPYPTVLVKAFRSGFAQLRKSWYMFFFQLPALPEALLRSGDYRALVRAVQGSANPGSFSDDDMARYRRAWGQQGALTSMVNWYRALFRGGGRGTSAALRVRVPTLMLWGENDFALGKELAQPSIDLCEHGRLVFFPNATHWLQHDEADAVNQHIHEFMSQ